MRYSDEFCLSVLCLKVASSEDSCFGFAMIVLDKRGSDSSFCKFVSMIAFEKKSSLIAMNSRRNMYTSLYLCFIKGEGHTSYFYI